MDRKKIQSFFLLSLLLYFGFVALLFFMQRSFLYFPHTDTPDITQADWAQPLEVLTKDELTLRAWWSAPSIDDKPTIILFHGNAGHIGHRIATAQKYIKQGYGLILAEYRGYGGNAGKPTERGLYEDARAYMNWAIESADIPSTHIILHGESLGTGVATQMATEYDIKALILETPFFSVLDTAQHHYPYVPFQNILVKDQYRSDLKMESITKPVLIGLAGQDTTIPMTLGKKLFEITQEPKQLKIYPQAGHMDLDQHGFAEDTVAFIEGL